MALSPSQRMALHAMVALFTSKQQEEALKHKERQAAIDRGEVPVERDWIVDQGKKNLVTKPCPRCGFSFCGKRERKYCCVCQPIIDSGKKAPGSHDDRPAPYDANPTYKTKKPKRGKFKLF